MGSSSGCTPCRFASSGTVASSRSASTAIFALNAASNFLRDSRHSSLHRLRQSRTFHTLAIGPQSGVQLTSSTPPRAHRFHQEYGTILGLIGALPIPVRRVSPTRWKKTGKHHGSAGLNRSKDAGWGGAGVQAAWRSGPLTANGSRACESHLSEGRGRWRLASLRVFAYHFRHLWWSRLSCSV